MLIIPPDAEVLHAMVRDGVTFYNRNGMAWTSQALVSYHDKEYGKPHVCEYCQEALLHVMQHQYDECDPMLFDAAGDLPRRSQMNIEQLGIIPTPQGLFVSLSTLPPEVQFAVKQKLKEAGYNGG